MRHMPFFKGVVVFIDLNNYSVNITTVSEGKIVVECCETRELVANPEQEMLVSIRPFLRPWVVKGGNYLKYYLLWYSDSSTENNRNIEGFNLVFRQK